MDFYQRFPVHEPFLDTSVYTQIFAASKVDILFNTTQTQWIIGLWVIDWSIKEDDQYPIYSMEMELPTTEKESDEETAKKFVSMCLADPSVAIEQLKSFLHTAKDKGVGTIADITLDRLGTENKFCLNDSTIISLEGK